MAKSKQKQTPPRSQRPVDASSRLGDLTNLQCIAIVFVLVFVFFHQILLGNAYFWEDFLYQNYPFRSFAATSLASGQLPLWNPYTFNGMPFLADIQTTVLYVPCLLLTLFVSNGTLSFYWLELLIILHYALAGVSMFFLAKSFTLRNTPSLFAGVAYMLSGFMVTHAIHQQIITMVAWYPLVLLLFRKAIEERQWLWVFGCGIVLGHSILAGYPQLSLYLYFFLLLFFLYELFSTQGVKRLVSRPSLVVSARAASVIGISVAVAMVQLLPTLELSQLSQRAEITYARSTEGSLTWSQLLTLFYPKLFGTAGAEGYNYWGPGAYWYYWETCIYLGALPTLLGLMAMSSLRKNRNVAFLGGFALFSILFAFGDNFFLYRLFFDIVPGFDKFRIPARMGIFIAFAMALLAGFAIQQLLYAERTKKESSTLRNVLLGAAGIALLGWGIIQTGGIESPAFKNPQVIALVTKSSNVALFVNLASAAVVLWILLKRRSPVIAGGVLVALFFVDMFLFGGTQNNATLNPAEYFKRTQSLVQFIKQEGEKEFFRVNTRNSEGMIMDRNQGMIDRIFMMEGYTPLALQRAYAPLATPDQSYDLLNIKYKTITDESTRSLSFVHHPTYKPRAFFLYKVHVVQNEDDLVRYLKSPEFDHMSVAVLENDPGRTLEPPSTQPAWSAEITSYTNNAITLRAKTSHAGLLVLSEIYYPGWKAYVDGNETEVFRTNFNLRGVFVSAGDHLVDVRFEPASFSRGATITIGTLLICVFGMIVSARRARKQASE